MESITIEKPKMITVECGNRFPHKPHAWREGFLWCHKRVCGGVPEWFRNVHIPWKSHRHSFAINDKTNDDFLVWHCMVEPCEVEYVQDRPTYVEQAVYGLQMNANPWEL
ncbi:hypothetical protein QCN36_gp74 [Arthrobacter phage CastorTray]|uniref:Uncharacterized protein n=1 Tax=Arthrobacter phage CastorTray TaxID=2859632 RepID=A0AAE7WE24_9CAUD|nr:hypothetical protein QCN36_gp74 [Arthrobacter phage CastorTray]QYC55079.1 hypothetical protein SEA_CASTORTRAY_74 [Arthrobacter phage CastorTray]